MLQLLQMKKPIGTEVLLSIPEAAKILGVDRSTVWRWVRQGKIECMAFGGLSLIPRQVVEERLKDETRGCGDTKPNS